MYTVYILQDENGKLYKGMTNNIERRFKEHSQGKTKTTARMGKLKIIYTENIKTFEEARKRELYFKISAVRRYIKDNIQDD